MSFTIKVRGAKTRTIAAEYYCEEHGRFELDIERTVGGDAPDTVPCPFVVEEQRPYVYHTDEDGTEHVCYQDALCEEPATWCVSAPLARVQKVTAAVKGKWQKPERATWTDTSNIAEGQPLYDWKEDRAKVWEEERKKDVMRFQKEHC